MLYEFLLFTDGIGFDPFFRGLLSVVALSAILVGGTYLLVATNTGARQGLLLSMSALFGWMFLMGIVWTVYGIGWVGEAPTWELEEINIDDADDDDDGLVFSELEEAQDLAGTVITVDEVDDPDEAQLVALEQVESGEIDIGDWQYLTTADPQRGEAQAAAETFLIEEGVFSAGEYVALQFGGFTVGGKEEKTEDTGLLEAAWIRTRSTILLSHPDKYMAVQVRPVIEQPILPGEAPPVAIADEEAELVTVLMRLDRGGPVPSFLSGLRFTPAAFTFWNFLLFVATALGLHWRDRREAEIVAVAGENSGS